MGQLSIEPARIRLDESDLERAPEERETTEKLRARAHLLVGEERALIAMYLDAGASVVHIAHVAGTSKSTMVRRVHKIIRRLSDETYPLCQKHRQRFSELELEIIRDHFVRGLPMSRICRDRNLGYYRARATILKARRLAQAMQGAQT